ncbi:MAG: hypothetical protein J5906_05480 [Acidaminococcaceae bacterium]|nr:hypothetical protein [Acidaminococcaceae bacterium]
MVIKKNKLLTALAMGAIMMQCSSALAEGNNFSCVMMRFTDDTRFDRVESTGTLSDLVLEKLLNSGKFNFKETKIIDQNMEKMLYDERVTDFRNARAAMSWGDYNKLFEGPGFNEKRAQSIATAQLGQIVSPDITSAIGKQHNADYLIQGTIINLGTGNWMNADMMKASMIANTAVSLLAQSGAANFLGPLGALASSFSIKETGVGVQADLRLIKAATGEVVWHKQLTGKDIQKQYSVLGVVKIGSDKLNNEMYFKAMEAASQAIANAIIEDQDAGKLVAN